MGALEKAVYVIPLEQVDPIQLPKGSWSRMLISDSTVPENASSLGYSVFYPGTVTDPVAHEVEELAFVVLGRGELRLADGVVPFGSGDALFIPANIWHAVANTGDEEMTMVFTFPHPDYPPTRRQ